MDLPSKALCIFFSLILSHFYGTCYHCQAKHTGDGVFKSKNIDFLSGQQISCKGSSMHTECQNIFIVEVVSLILDKLRNET